MTAVERYEGATRAKIRNFALCALGATALLSAACSSPQERYDRYMNSGAEFLDNGRLGQANVQFLNALKIREDDVPALSGLAQIAEKRSNYEQMFGILQRIHNLKPDDDNANINLAKLYLLSEDTGKAMEHVETVLKAQPQNAKAIALKAAIMFRVQNIADAVDLAKQALALDPNLEEAVAVLAGERVQAEDFDGALSILDSAIEKNAKAAVLHILRVQILDTQNRTDDLDAAYRTLVEEFPDNADYRRLYASTLMEAERFEEARAQLVEVVRVHPRQLDPKLDVARIDYRIGGSAKAEETLRAYVAADPDDLDLEFSLAAFFREEKEYDKAGKIYREILNGHKRNLNTVLRAKNELAGLSMLRGDRARAEKLIDEVIAAEPKNPQALVKRAGLLIDDGKAQDAVANLRIVLGERPDSVPARMLMAAALEATGDVSFAESEFAQAVETSKRASKPSLLFARFLVRNGKRARAEKVLADSISRDPGAVENLKMLAGLRLDNQDWRGAEEAANALRAADSADADISRILGAAYAGLQDYAGAIDVLSKENERAPLSAQPLVTLVQAYIDAGRTQDAENFLADTIEKNPEFYEARVLLAQVNRSLDKRDEALAVLNEAIEVDPLRSEAYEAAYGVYVLSGRREEAGRIIEQAVSAIPDNDGLQMLRADNLIAIGDEDGAIAIYETILAHRPSDHIVANNLASLLSNREDAASRARAAEAAAPLKDTENAYFLDTYGWAMHRSGRTSEGVEALRRAVRAAPDLVEARYHLGVALSESGLTDQGAAELRAVAETPDADAELVEDARRRLEAL
ncbi:MAG: tetratricopeptide repeat protein [Parvularculaceae bacterium]|nr:tetratricopeptide repeat protein [Parvularculaceae bacterium]